MLFNSFIFIFIFLPCVLVGFHLISKKGWYQASLGWLVGASLFFYGWWNPKYLLLIVASILVNFSLGSLLQRNHNKTVLFFGILFNLGLIAYYKYANFFIDTINSLTGNNLLLYEIILPLAISFFTFQQIAYLVDARRGETKSYTFLHYVFA